ncbi:MAG: hypothetical protein ACRD3D_01105 [Terriglobia bacterium]
MAEMHVAKSAGGAGHRGEKKVLAGITVHKAENGGHVAEHNYESDGGAYHAPEHHAFGKHEGSELLKHLTKHLGIRGDEADEPEEEPEEETEE